MVVAADDDEGNRPVTYGFVDVFTEAEAVAVESPPSWPITLAAEKDILFAIVMEAADVDASGALIGLVESCSRQNIHGIARKLCQCVDRVHQLDYVHCDLKPQHFLRFKEEWKLIDFGSAKRTGTRTWKRDLLGSRKGAGGV